ncbi:rhomboid family intramembrane serine protease [Natronospirillum operosum]|uniref:Rhomboid family intramembrane serine protease n=1 Tax=Natronospirillum operosum TaxID=2759953 RepID=A0A4Z0WH45_9GAMM|nr:rhomboid family intramembrane serine protease [Natronospirillum operosum]TGG95086.1 rhomboid family intramembrane serine protease [Natronospirillum operosum]
MSPIAQLLTPRRGYVITPLIIYLNSAIFVFFVLLTQQVMWFPAEVLAHWGANFGPWTSDGQWWRLLSSVFLHGGLLHLVFNTLILANIGIMLEPLLGRWLYTGLYLLTGALASLTSVYFNYGAVSVGASGAIFGLYGYFLALLLSDLFRPEIRGQFLRGTVVFVGINLALGFTVPMIDNAAHLGGLAAGAILGFATLPLVRYRLLQR